MPAMPSKKRKTEDARPAAPGELEIGTAVLYAGGRGRIYESFEEVDQYWVEDQDTGDVVRDASGEIIDFSCADLQLAPVEATTEDQDQVCFARGGVLLLGTEKQMVKIIHHFGQSNMEERTTPQQLLAIPSRSCIDGLAKCAMQGVESGLRELAARLRSDIKVGIRVAQLKQAAKQLGEQLLKLEDYFCLASVHLPYDWNAIEAASPAEALRRSDVWNQIDVCVTAFGEAEGPLGSTNDAARKALGEPWMGGSSGSLRPSRPPRKKHVDLQPSMGNARVKHIHKYSRYCLLWNATSNSIYHNV
ncbi:unnamed protein product [Effrenium voratum]|nr:unnamed protein product [Effrenium voratum]